MLFGLLRALARIRVTVAYTAILACVTTAMMTLGPQAQSRIISHASTNLHNLSRGHLGTLFVSAFVIDAGPIYVWLPGLVCLLAVAELMWRSGRLVVAFAAGHIGATLLVAIGLTAAVELGWMSSDVTRATDVGMSYGASAVLGALTAAIPRRWRPAWTGWWIAVAVAVVGIGRDFTDVGHAVALMLGMVVASRFGRAARWSRGALSAAHRRFVLRISDAGQQRPDTDRRHLARHVGCRHRRGRGRTATRPRRSAAGRRPFVRADAGCRVTPLSSGDHL